ncbi:hypothetical protein [Photobacterium alginatilyticum]|uniref:Uncharacterized protein n=1 Tax=Photobacterium alginatilyticum TaxID=1775171 RepID=A0ABW9YL34_9GAMM|nr:hypothetical protein [Photobacterium alginatilyticum]NBI54257.1 hypothetical protein [Photobacterium alginatilyticum]
MTSIIILFGLLIILIGSFILVRPTVVFGYLRRHLGSLQIHVLAVVVRLIIGFLLIAQSDVSRFPFIIEIIGWLSLIAGFILAAIGRRSFHRLMAWALSFAKPYGRIGGTLAAAFGAFIVYAFV